MCVCFVAVNSWEAEELLAGSVVRCVYEFKILQCITSLHVPAELQASKTASGNRGLKKELSFSVLHGRKAL